MKERIFLSSPHMSDEGYEKGFIKEAFDTNWIAPLGTNVNEFEKEMANYIGAKDTVALSAGTAAIHLALKSVGVKQGDYVFCQSLTFSASANPIVYEKAIPVFIGSEEETWNMSPTALETALLKYIKDGKKPKAVIVVHLYGIAAKIVEIRELCDKYNVALIEDSAESLGTRVNNQYTGTFGDYGILSFNGNKIITSSGGGMLICNTDDAKERAQKARFWATQSRENERHYEHKEIGYNYRMSNIVAGIGRGQLKVLKQRVEKKRAIYEMYKNGFEEITDISMMPKDKNGNFDNNWLTTILINKDSKVRPLDIMVALENENIESRPVWKPMHMQPVFKDCDYISDNKVAEDIFERGVCLPSDTKLSVDQINIVIGLIKELWK